MIGQQLPLTFNFRNAEMLAKRAVSSIRLREEFAEKVTTECAQRLVMYRQ